MIDLILWLAIGGVSVAGLSQYISRLIDSEEAYQSSQLLSATPPDNSPNNSEPAYNLPTAWGGPPPTIPNVNDSPVTAENVFPHLPDLPKRPHTSGNHYTISDSAIQLTKESGVNRPRIDPESGGESGGESALLARLADLIQLTPLPTTGPFGEDEYELFCLLKACKKNQSDTIKTMYGVSTNGSAKYAAARERYLALCKTKLTVDWKE